MNILILGGTGAIGAHLAAVLVDHGVVTVTSRSDRDNTGGIKYLKGDAKDLVFLDEVLQSDWDAIVDFMIYSTEEFKERVEKLLSSTNQYVFISSSRVYAESDSLIDEDSPRLLDSLDDKNFLRSDEYSLAKARQEDVLLNTGLKNWTVVRPYITYNYNRMQLGVFEKEGWLYRALKGRSIIVCQDVNTKLTSLTHGLDVSLAIASLIGKEEAFGDYFHTVNNQPMLWDEVLTIYVGVLEKYLLKKPKILKLPLIEFSKCHSERYQLQYDRMFDRQFSLNKLSKYVDAKGFIEPSIGLERCIEQFLKAPRFNKISWRYEAIKDRLAGEVTPLSEIPTLTNKIKYILFRYLLR